MLSLGEQQRLGIARAILQAPDYLFLDEATASLDEAAEAAVYRLLDARLKHATIVSIGHRSTLSAFHGRGLVFVRDGEFHRMHEVRAGSRQVAALTTSAWARSRDGRGCARRRRRPRAGMPRRPPGPAESSRTCR